MDTANNVDNAAAEQHAPATIPSTEVDVLEATMIDTPADIKSSPPPAVHLTSTALKSRDVSPTGAKSDSEAETVVLPGVNGHSPSKIRRVIKLEDKSNDRGTLEGVEEKAPELQRNTEMEGAQNRSEGAPSALGKRKRAKHGNRLEHSHNGNSSGLSSIPTSPVATTRSTLPSSKHADSESDISKSPSPRLREAHGHKTSRSIDQSLHRQKDRNSISADDKDQRRVARDKGTRVEAAGSYSKINRESHSKPQSDNHNTHRMRSTSPTSQEARRSTSRQPSGTSINGLSQKKKKVPAPLRATRDRRSSDDDSSAGESPHPRRSRTRNLATPPTGESSASLAKMTKKRRFQYGLSALAVACEHGDVKKARQELQEAPEDIDFPDNAGNTPLQCASINGHAGVVRLLIESGCNVHCVNSKKDSPLLDAAENGHLEVVRVLLAAGVNPRARNLQGEEPLNKVDDDYEDADAIREALLAARVVAPPRQQSPALQPPSHTKNAGSVSSTNPRTLSHGRSTKTGENQLFIGLNVESLRSAAGAGDQGTVFRIMDAISVNGLDDPESLVAAARGGHYDVLQLLLALGSMNRDPDPLPHKDPEHATPILAAIGGDNIEVIRLLLGSPDDGGFDPTRKYDGRTYLEIAKERAGPYWQEECRILREASEKYKPSSSSRRHAGGSPGTSRLTQKRSAEERSKTKHPKDGGTSRPIKRESSNADGTPIKRGPGRPRKEDREHREHREHQAISDHESAPKKPKVARKSDSDAATLPSESEPSKPRRKLISGKDLRGERERRASIASVKSTVSPSDGLTSTDAIKDNHGTSDGASRTANRASEPMIGTEKPLDRARSLKRDDSKDRLSVIRGESPAKRPRSSLSPSESQASGAGGSDMGASHKRRRLESDSKINQKVRTRRSSSPDPRTNRSVSASHSDKNSHKSLARDTMRDAKRELIKTSEGRDSKISSTPRKEISPQTLSAKSNSSSKRVSSPSEVRTSVEQEAKALKQRIEAETRIKREAEEEEKAQKESDRIAQREREAREAADARKVREEKEAKVAEEERKAKQEKLAKEAEEARKAQEEIEAKAARDAEEAAQRKLLEEAMQREQEEEAKRMAEEAARREAEEAEQREKQKREEAQASIRADEERRRLYIEQQRVQREEQEARRALRMAEQAAERQRVFKEQEAARLAKLPPLLRWLDGCEKPATPELAHTFRSLQGVRYDTILHTANAISDGREQWLLNTQVALLLGEKDLQLSRCEFIHL
jgi:ankyrin repeat protein